MYVVSLLYNFFLPSEFCLRFHECIKIFNLERKRNVSNPFCGEKNRKKMIKKKVRGALEAAQQLWMAAHCR